MSLNTYPGNPFPPSTEQMHEGDNEDLQAQIDAIKDGADIDSFGDVESALATKTDIEVIAPEFDAEAGTYDIGDLVTYQGKLYEFTSAHETAGDWDSTEVTEKTVSDEIDTLKSGLIDVTAIRETLNGGTAWPGDTLIFNVRKANDVVYKFLAIKSTGSDSTSQNGYIVVKTDNSVLICDKVGTFTASYDDTTQKITVTLPDSSYWNYRMEKCASKKG